MRMSDWSSDVCSSDLHEADTYVQEARRLGFRVRAAFKLKEIQEKDKILRPGQIVVDLGAAPGSWSQFARPLLGAKGQLLALDILSFDPIQIGRASCRERV